jgi:hypothetical protein
VVHSAKGIALPVAALALVTGLAGCVTTQEKNSWLLLRNARQLASETPVHVTHENPGVRVSAVQFVDSAHNTAIAVSLRNLTDRPLTDLPISVGGIVLGHKRVYFNRDANIDYWDTHVAALPARGSVTWVLPAVPGRPAGRPFLIGGKIRPFAIVGMPSTPASTTARVLPRIGIEPRGAETADPLLVSIANHSSLPQYGLQVYAVAVRDGRDVSVARTAIGELGSDSSMTVGLKLLGEPGGGTVELYAPPTIFK